MTYRTVADLGRRGVAAPMPAASLADARRALSARRKKSPGSKFKVQVRIDGAWEDYE